jgi:hypothetical protein
VRDRFLNGAIRSDQVSLPGLHPRLPHTRRAGPYIRLQGLRRVRLQLKAQRSLGARPRPFVPSTATPTEKFLSAADSPWLGRACRAFRSAAAPGASAYRGLVLSGVNIFADRWEHRFSRQAGRRGDGAFAALAGACAGSDEGSGGER